MSEKRRRIHPSQRIIEHGERKVPYEEALGDAETIERVSDHLTRHLAEPTIVFHEITSDLVHLDVHVIAPDEERDFFTLVTSGMSEYPMSAPEGSDLPRYAELLVCLPRDWPLTPEAFKDERNYWPVRWLKSIARLPHEFDTWIGAGHTVPNGDPPAPFAEDTELCCMLALNPPTLPEEFTTLEVSPDKTIRFFCLAPIYREELDYKLKHGTVALVKRLNRVGVTELVDPRRPNTCR